MDIFFDWRWWLIRKIWYYLGWSQRWQKTFDSEPVCNKKVLRTKIKPHGDKITDFYDEEIPKVDYNHTRLAVISLHSALKKDKGYYCF